MPPQSISGRWQSWASRSTGKSGFDAKRRDLSLSVSLGYKIAPAQGGLIVVAPLLDRFGSLTFVPAHLLVRDKVEHGRDAVEPRAPLVVGADDVPGRDAVSVALSITSRAREYSYQRRVGPDPSGSASTAAADRRCAPANRRSCSSLPTSSQNLIRMMPAVDDVASRTRGTASRKRSVLLARCRSP